MVSRLSFAFMLYLGVSQYTQNTSRKEKTIEYLKMSDLVEKKNVSFS